MEGQSITLNIEEAIERMGEKEIYREIAHYFAAHLHESLANLRKAIDAGDAAESTRFAHSLKGNCATVGADSLREECLTIENLCRQGQLFSAGEQLESMLPRMFALQKLLSDL